MPCSLTTRHGFMESSGQDASKCDVSRGASLYLDGVGQRGALLVDHTAQLDQQPRAKAAEAARRRGRGVHLQHSRRWFDTYIWPVCTKLA